jgi:hypothetical protein
MANDGAIKIANEIEKIVGRQNADEIYLVDDLADVLADEVADETA